MPVNDERGAIAVLVAITLTVLMGVGALVLDVGALYVERRELQNGADAAALAIAESCALDECPTTAAEDAAAEVYADANSLDGISAVDDVDVDEHDRTVTVETSTATAEGDEVQFGFAKIFGFDGSTVSADATATWDVPEALDAFPVTISTREYRDGATVLLCFKKTSSDECEGGDGGSGDGPGSFGYVSATDCTALNADGGPLTVGDETIDVDHGNDGPKNLGCLAVEDLLPDPDSPTELRTILLPVHESLIGGRYSIVGFAALEVDAFRFTGANDEWCSAAPLKECSTVVASPNARWVHGTFVRYVARGAVLSQDPKATYTGVAAVELTA